LLTHCKYFNIIFIIYTTQYIYYKKKINDNKPLYDLLISCDLVECYFLSRPLSEFITLIDTLDTNVSYPNLLFYNVIYYIMNYDVSLDKNGILLQSYTPLFNIFKFYKFVSIPFFTKLNIDQMHLIISIIKSTDNSNIKINMKRYKYIYHYYRHNNHYSVESDNSYIYDLFVKINNAKLNNSYTTQYIDKIKYIISNIQIEKTDIIGEDDLQDHFVPELYYVNNFQMCFSLLLDNNNFIIDIDMLCCLLNFINYDDLDLIINKIMLRNNITIDYACLKYICRYGDVAKIKFILDFKIKPTTELFDIFIKWFDLD